MSDATLGVVIYFVVAIALLCVYAFWCGIRDSAFSDDVFMMIVFWPVTVPMYIAICVIVFLVDRFDALGKWCRK